MGSTHPPSLRIEAHTALFTDQQTNQGFESSPVRQLNQLLSPIAASLPCSRGQYGGNPRQEPRTNACALTEAVALNCWAPCRALKIRIGTTSRKPRAPTSLVLCTGVDVANLLAVVQARQK
jgi:hypothetical protein